jgi:hypothetical protein
MIVTDLTGKTLCEKEFTQEFVGAKSIVLSTPCFKGELKTKNCVVRFEWNDAQGNNHTRTFSRLPSNRNKADRKEIKLEIVSINTEKKTAVLKVENTKFLHHFWLYSAKAGVQFSENFIELLPGEHLIEVQFEELPLLSDFDFMWM